MKRVNQIDPKLVSVKTSRKKAELVVTKTNNGIEKELTFYHNTKITYLRPL